MFFPKSIAAFNSGAAVHTGVIMYSIEIEDSEGEISYFGETFDCLTEATRAARRLECEDADIESAVVVVTETGEQVS
ncbi:hypothetical protein [Erwinia aphidicola]|uniref:hypothetical protein n=1 Tax=Erwinia aphidicola TaxID=68334 RepID=UPI003D262EC0